MSAAILLAELEYAGIRLQLDGPHLVADVLPHADLDLYRELIAEHKPALLAELTPLDAEIIASEARRHTHEVIARRIVRIEGRIGTADELPGDRLSLRYWRAIDCQKRESGRDA
jgi:hypothetical protein